MVTRNVMARSSSFRGDESGRPDGNVQLLSAAPLSATPLSASGPGLELGHQRLDRAAALLDHGVELRAPGHEQADARHLDVDDARALAVIAHVPRELKRRQIAQCIDAAVDRPGAGAL